MQSNCSGPTNIDVSLKTLPRRRIAVELFPPANDQEREDKSKAQDWLVAIQNEQAKQFHLRYRKLELEEKK